MKFTEYLVNEGNVTQGQFGRGRSEAELKIRELAMNVERQLEQILDGSNPEYRDAIGPDAIREASKAIDKIATVIMRHDHPQHFKR